MINGHGPLTKSNRGITRLRSFLECFWIKEGIWWMDRQRIKLAKREKNNNKK